MSKKNEMDYKKELEKLYYLAVNEKELCIAFEILRELREGEQK
ncbi:hypothetical protein LCGC14_2201240 [marine sediment metagenome]|uniref:Uncharacterized protein n=1 Tax=marine sediment metagenome TaxID=412755 RepID=A0A0F9GCJ0_9ZZZZ